jgi:ADP-ribose pyrophosphatase YjhB (NUDIX family)
VSLYPDPVNTHCAHCGTAFAPDQPWPRACAGCGKTSYRNPLPVAVLLLPVGDGLLVLRRTVEPQLGGLALPGGFIEVGESWQEAAVRELREETGLVTDVAGVRLFDALSAPDGTVLIFGLAAWTRALPPLTATAEASEFLVIEKAQELAFPLHTQVVARYFDGR